MNILWFLEKELDVSLSASGRLATVENLAKKNDLIVVTGYRHTKIKFKHLKTRIIYLESSTIPILKRILFFENQLKFLESYAQQHSIDVVLVNSFNYFLLKKIVSDKKHKNYTVVFDIRTLPVDSGYLRRIVNEFLFIISLKYASRYCDGITYITEEMRSYCKKRYNLPDHKSEVWCSGVDPELFKNLKCRDNGKTDRYLKMIYHGTVNRNRGIDNVIRAIYMLKNIIPIKFSMYIAFGINIYSSPC